MDIKRTTPLKDLIEEHPQLDSMIGMLLPAYGNLKQPHLKEKVLAVNTIDHLARMIDQDTAELMKAFQKSSGLKDAAGSPHYMPSDPAWIKKEPVEIIDGSALLMEGKHPLAVIESSFADMSSGEIICLRTNFYPQPMVEAMEKQGAEVFSREQPEKANNYLTFIQK